MTLGQLPPVPLPPPDPHVLLTKIERAIMGNTEEVSRGNVTTREATSTPRLLLVGFVALIATAVFAWISWRRTREIAALRHEKNKKKVEEANLRVMEHVEDLDSRRDVLRREVIGLKEKQRTLEKDIDAEQRRYEADRDAIERITSWRDL